MAALTFDRRRRIPRKSGGIPRFGARDTTEIFTETLRDIEVTRPGKAPSPALGCEFEKLWPDSMGKTPL
jgi:hypothetical protein